VPGLQEIAAEAHRRIEDGTLDAVTVLSAVDQLARGGDPAAASALYRAWVERNPSHPLLYAVHYNLGDLFSARQQHEPAIACLQAAIRAKDDFLPAYINLGLAFEQTGNLRAAVDAWRSAVDRMAMVNAETVNGKLLALKHLGRLLADADLDRTAEEAFQLSLALDPLQPDVIQHWINVRQRQCRWPVIRPPSGLTAPALLRNISPLLLAGHRDDPLWQLANAAHYNELETQRPQGGFPDRDEDWKRRAASRPLRIGYLSSDLCNHAVGFLTAEIYALHDRSEIEVFAYYTGGQNSDRIRLRIEASIEHWRDLSSLSDRDAAQCIHDDDIAILVDLNGHTKGSRVSLLAYRPAPIIVNWLGYPGTMGSPLHNYIIADSFIIPEEDELYYSEKVIRLPCYQPTDRQRLVGDPISRASVGLPEHALVYCCFNEARKISEESWNAWVEILKQTPDSVLWLMVPAAGTQAHLRDLLEAQGIDPIRLIFTGRRPNPDHLARYPLADIVLDTFPYGAHTTASDALWMGVPVITRVGRGFASRVCGSLLRAVGLPELICRDDAEFVAKAVDLGKSPTERARLCERLRLTRESCILFDTPGLVTALERLYLGMWSDYEAGNLPQPDLSNLAAYQDVAVELDSLPAEREAYHRLYQEALSAIGRYRFLGRDPRLLRDIG